MRKKIIFGSWRFNKIFVDSKYVFIFILLSGLCAPSLCLSQALLCRPWQNVFSNTKIGESFTSKIENGLISFFGEERPVSHAQLIYSHPLHDIFLAASGEIVTAALEGGGVSIKVYFPSTEVKFFVTASCRKV